LASAYPGDIRFTLFAAGRSIALGFVWMFCSLLITLTLVAADDSHECCFASYQNVVTGTIEIFGIAITSGARRFAAGRIAQYQLRRCDVCHR